MGKGFAPIKAKPKKPAAQRAKLNPISQIQADLSSYFTDIKDPRVNRTKKHLLKDILVIAILAIIALCRRLGRHRKLWLCQATVVVRIFRVTSWNPSAMTPFVGFSRGSIP